MNIIDSLQHELKNAKTIDEGISRWLFQFGGQRVDLPKCMRTSRNREIREEFRRGASYAELAKQHGLSERQIRRICV
ncbi:MAG: Mor transcription activator family protein [Dechloromonas sp.]|nr:Mor transcription activator family protein [Dechloromonas sp.]